MEHFKYWFWLLVPEGWFGRWCKRWALMAESLLVLQAELGYNMTLLDIGGGFPGSDDTKLKFEEVMSSPVTLSSKTYIDDLQSCLTRSRCGCIWFSSCPLISQSVNYQAEERISSAAGSPNKTLRTSCVNGCMGFPSFFGWA